MGDSWTTAGSNLERALLIAFEQFLNAPGVPFAVAVAGQRIAAAGGFNDNSGPDQSGLDMHRSDFLNADADLVAAEPGALAPQHGSVSDFDDCGKKMVARCPSAGFECLGCHVLITSGVILKSSLNYNRWIFFRRALVDFPGTTGRSTILTPNFSSRRRSSWLMVS